MDQPEQGIMTYFEAEAHSFVMRIWREHRDDPEAPAEWRGWLEHVQSEQRHYFRNLAEIPDIVAVYLSEPVGFTEQVFMPIQPKNTTK